MIQRRGTNVFHRRSTVLHLSFRTKSERSPDYRLSSLTTDGCTYWGLLHLYPLNYTCAKGSAKGVVSLGPCLDRKSRDRRVGRPEPLVKKCFPRGPFEYGSKANPLEMRSARSRRNDDGYKLLNDLWI